MTSLIEGTSILIPRTALHRIKFEGQLLAFFGLDQVDKQIHKSHCFRNLDACCCIQTGYVNWRVTLISKESLLAVHLKTVQSIE